MGFFNTIKQAARAAKENFGQKKTPNQGKMGKDRDGAPYWTGPEDAYGRPRLCRYNGNNDRYYRDIEIALKLADQFMSGEAAIRFTTANDLVNAVRASCSGRSLNLITAPIVELRLHEKWNVYKSTGKWWPEV